MWTLPFPIWQCKPQNLDPGWNLRWWWISSQMIQIASHQLSRNIFIFHVQICENAVSHLPVVQVPHPSFLLKIQYRSPSYKCSTQEAKRPPDKCALHLEWSPPRKHSCFPSIKRQYWPLLEREMVSQWVHLPCLGQWSLLLFLLCLSLFLWMSISSCVASLTIQGLGE